MFDFLKGNPPTDIKGIRNEIVLFIKEQLQKTEGGEGRNISEICVFVSCKEVEKHLYEGALYINDEGRFKEDEVQKIADDFAIDLPTDWIFGCQFVDQFPDKAVRANEIDIALFIVTKGRPKVNITTTAFVKVLVGIAEKESYQISSTSGKITIGREKRTQTNNGQFRENVIAFTETVHDANKSVSRQHGHIEWNKEMGDFYLFADEGGIPPNNKLKVRSVGGDLLKLQAMEIGYRLKQGDQIILGDAAILEFSFGNE